VRRQFRKAERPVFKVAGGKRKQAGSPDGAQAAPGEARFEPCILGVNAEIRFDSAKRIVGAVKTLERNTFRCRLNTAFQTAHVFRTPVTRLQLAEPADKLPAAGI